MPPAGEVADFIVSILIDCDGQRGAVHHQGYLVVIQWSSRATHRAINAAQSPNYKVDAGGLVHPDVGCLGFHRKEVVLRRKRIRVKRDCVFASIFEAEPVRTTLTRTSLLRAILESNCRFSEWYSSIVVYRPE